MPELGYYNGYPIADGAAITESGKKKSPQFSVNFCLTQFWQHDQWTTLPKPLNWLKHFSMTDAAMEYSRRDLESIGFNGDLKRPAFSTGPENPIQVEIVLGNSYTAADGTTKTGYDLKIGNNGGPKEIKPASDDLVRQLQAKWGKPAKPIARPAAVAAPTPPANPINADGAELGRMVCDLAGVAMANRTSWSPDDWGKFGTALRQHGQCSYGRVGEIPPDEVAAIAERVTTAWQLFKAGGDGDDIPF